MKKTKPAFIGEFQALIVSQTSHCPGENPIPPAAGSSYIPHFIRSKLITGAKWGRQISAEV